MTKEDKRITDWLSVLALAMSCVTLLIIFSTKVDLPTVYPAGHGWGEPEASVSITIDPFVGEKTPRAWECNDDGMCGDPNVWDLENAHIIWHSEPTPNPPEAPEPRPQDCSLQPVVPVNASIPVGGSYSLRWPELR